MKSDVSSADGGEGCPSEPILLAARPFALRLATGFADARDDQPVAGDVKAVLLGHAIAQRNQLVALELDQLVATLAVEMIVLGIAVVVLVDGPAIQLELAQAVPASTNSFSVR